MLTTPGPRDVMPSFSAAGRRLVLRSQRSTGDRSLRRREFMPEIHVDPQGPLWPVPRPTPRTVAYLTWLNTPRLKVAFARDRSRARSRRGDRRLRAGVDRRRPRLGRCNPPSAGPNGSRSISERAADPDDGEHAGDGTGRLSRLLDEREPVAGALPSGARRRERVVRDSRDPDAGVAMTSAAPSGRQTETLRNRRVRRSHALLDRSSPERSSRSRSRTRERAPTRTMPPSAIFLSMEASSSGAVVKCASMTDRPTFARATGQQQRTSQARDRGFAWQFARGMSGRAGASYETSFRVDIK